MRSRPAQPLRQDAALSTLSDEAYGVPHWGTGIAVTSLTLQRPRGVPAHQEQEEAAEAEVARAVDAANTDGVSQADLHAQAIRIIHARYPILRQAAALGRTYLRRSPHVRAVTLESKDCRGSSCASCTTFSASLGCGNCEEAPSSFAAQMMDALYLKMLRRAVRELQLHSFSALGSAVPVLGPERLTGAPLRILNLSYIPEPAWLLVVAPLVSHHGGSLRDLTLAGVSDKCRPNETRVGLVFNACDGGMPTLRSLTLTHVFFTRGDATAVAAACRALTRLKVSGRIGRGAGPAVDARALPHLNELTWVPSTPWSLESGLTPLLAGRSLHEAHFGCHTLCDGAPPPIVNLLRALSTAAALPVRLGFFTAGTFDDTNLRRLVDSSSSVSQVESVRMDLGGRLTGEGLAALGRLPSLKSLCIRLTDERCADAFRAWPFRRLAHLHVTTTEGLPTRVLIQALLTGVASSPSAPTLRLLGLACSPLEARSEGKLLGRLSRLQRLDCYLVDASGVPYVGAARAAAAASMGRLMRELLPRATFVANIPSQWGSDLF